MGMNKKASPKYLSVSGSGTAAINGSAVKITFSRNAIIQPHRNTVSPATEFFAGNPFRCEVKVDLEKFTPGL